MRVWSNSRTTAVEAPARRWLSGGSAAALVLGLLVSTTSTASPAAAAQTTRDLTVAVVAANDVGTGSGAVHAGDPVTEWTYLLQKLDVGDPNGNIANCLPPSNNGTTIGGASSFDANYPNNCDWPGTRESNATDPIITSGDQSDLADPTKVTNLDPGQYLISVRSDGYEIGGAHFTVPLPAGSPVQVKLNAGPLPLATVRVRVFEDSAPVDGTYEIGAEDGLPGFRAYLADLLGDVSTDFFGNPLCTKYEISAPTGTHPAGEVQFDADGAPIIAADNTGACTSDGLGDIVIPNMAPGRYGITVRPPADKSGWYQTTTLEGATDHDWWVMAGDTGYGSETQFGSELVPEVQFGFIPPRSAATPLPGGLTSAGDGAITGKLHEGCPYVGSPGGFVGTPNGTANGLPGLNGPETMDCGPITIGRIAVSNLDLGDQLVATASTGADGSFSVPGLRDGNYMLAFFDSKMQHILETQNITITGGATEDLGVALLSSWFTKISGYVFIDDNGNGKKDPGETGVASTTLTLHERDNSLMDQFTNTIDTDTNGHYVIDQMYPLTRFLVLEHVNSRYRPTGFTTQSCNDKKSHTWTGAAVDISVQPVLGLCGRVDWAVEPIPADATGGIAGTVSYGVTRNELDPAQSAFETWQPGVPNIPVHLYAPVVCGSDLASLPEYAGNDCAADGEPMTTPVVRDVDGKVISGGALVHGPELTTAVTSETYHRPTGCLSLDRFGNVNTEQRALPASGQKGLQCAESNMVGTQSLPQEGTELVAGELPAGDNAQEVNGNYGFSDSDLNLIPPVDNGDGTFSPASDPVTGAALIDDFGHPLALYAPLDGTTIDQVYTFDAQPLTPGDYIVSIDIPQDKYGKPMYKVTREEDVNIFQGDEFAPQENFPLASAAEGVDAPPGDPGTGLTSGSGVAYDCGGELHTVQVTDPDFLAGGGSPYEGLDRPLCTDKIVQLQGGGTGATSFELFTDVPLATHFWGLILNDLGLQADPTSLGYDEAEALPHVPTGIYDWRGNLVDTVESDRNGYYEAVEPSTTRINNPSPAGVSPGVYRFVGNDPGLPGQLNEKYNSRFRTIATNFQAWPGLWTVTDTAPTAAASSTFVGGSQTLVSCAVPTGEPQLFAVDKVVTSGATTLTITGRDLGQQGLLSKVLLSAPNGSANDPAASTVLTPTSWTSTSITVSVDAAGPGFAPGPRQLLVVKQDGTRSASGVTVHVTGTDGTTTYNPAVYEVGPGRAFATIQGAIDQAELDLAATPNGTAPAQPLVVVHPGVPDAANPSLNPRGEYLENLVIARGVRVQGFGPGGFLPGGAYVDGSIIDGQAFQEGGATGTAWNARVTSASYAGQGTPVPDAATVTVLAPAGGQGGTQPGVDGFRITGGHEQNVTTNLNVLTYGQQTPYGATGAAITQGGAVYVHAGTDGLTITNNVMEGNSGTYGAVRIGTPYVNDTSGESPVGAPSTSYPITNKNLVMAHNSIVHNGGYNLAGGVGIYSGTVGYRLAYNDVCGNFGGEYGGGITHYGVSRDASIDHNRIWFNQSYDEGGGLMVAGELTPDPAVLSDGSGEVTITQNRIAQNTANDDGGGIRLLNVGNWPVHIENDEIVNNVSTHEGGGIALADASNVTIDHATIAGNYSTATAVTSNGQPAAAGLALSGLSDMLKATLPSGAPGYTKPTLFNNIFWDNRAGSYDGVGVSGIGLAGAGDINLWDIGSQDGAGTYTVDVANSVLNTFDSTTSSAGAPGTNSGDAPQFTTPFAPRLVVNALRTFGTFTQTIVVDQNVNPWDTADYRFPTTSPAYGLGTGTNAPAVDIDDYPRAARWDAGSWQFRTALLPPDAPTSVTVAPADHGLKVSWLAPADTGGAPVIQYVATAWTTAVDGTAVGTCIATTTLTCTIPGLTLGTEYFVDVTATNQIGTGPASSPRVGGIPATLPGAPRAVAVGPLNHGLRVTWTAPVSDGGTPITSYVATAYSSRTNTTVRGTCTAVGALTCDMVSPNNGPGQLNNGQTYWVSVRAVNVVGTGPASAPRVSGVPATVPSAPLFVQTSSAPLGITVGWLTGGSGGSAITRFTARAWTASAGGTIAGTCIDGPGLTGSCKIPGLTAGRAYYVDVVATNAVGTGPASAPRSRRVAGAATAPGAPSGLNAARGDRSVQLTWTAPSENGGSAVVGYRIQVSTNNGATWSTLVADTGNSDTAYLVTGLTNGQSYRFRIAARNALVVAFGSNSGSVSATPAAPPAAPTITTALGGRTGTGPSSGSIRTTWTLGANNGSTITSSTATAYRDAALTDPARSCTATGTGSSCTITGLARTTTYWVVVTSANGAGTSTRSATRQVSTT